MMYSAFSLMGTDTAKVITDTLPGPHFDTEFKPE